MTLEAPTADVVEAKFSFVPVVDAAVAPIAAPVVPPTAVPIGFAPNKPPAGAPVVAIVVVGCLILVVALVAGNFIPVDDVVVDAGPITGFVPVAVPITGFVPEAKVVPIAGVLPIVEAVPAVRVDVVPVVAAGVIVRSFCRTTGLVPPNGFKAVEPAAAGVVAALPPKILEEFPKVFVGGFPPIAGLLLKFIPPLAGVDAA